jgi:hypothetical protein
MHRLLCLQFKLREMWGTGELQQLLMMARETTWTFDLVGVSWCMPGDHNDIN